MEIELENVHLAVLLITALVIVYNDHEGLAYVRGKREVLNPKVIRWSHRFVWLGFGLMVLTGVALVLPAWEYWLADPTFYVKMGFVVTLLINGVFIGKLSHVAVERPFALLSREEKVVLLTSGALSGIGWLGAAGIGLFVL